MLACAIALRLAAAVAAPVDSPTVDVAPPAPAEVAPPGPGRTAAPDLSAPPPPPADRPGPWRVYGAAAAGAAASDVLFAGIFAIGMVQLFGDLWDGEASADAGGLTLALVGLGGFLAVTPAVTVWAAQRVAGRERTAAAYWACFGVRLLGFAAANAFPAATLATELVLAPWVVSRIVMSGAPAATPLRPEVPAPAGADGPATRARPLRDPALAWR
ncbi:hypothetical protein [Anaeromyxobacter dehalogenans]|uniref:Uncharacterized protein n=1 Tax=Anaeromyxobacter dehalogenans (strain 2CP-C) TaxID=290397 RepID=Q2IHF6_ANADE|nr:hypothetical protein [Anaeromyxobacter dehalogenans]ABC84017.1 hypothetical protein Adeh_4253 [Anaeromyxobacter dehalogenans 2CP-C]